jgi:hypothetical protein
MVRILLETVGWSPEQREHLEKTAVIGEGGRRKLSVVLGEVMTEKFHITPAQVYEKYTGKPPPDSS